MTAAGNIVLDHRVVVADSGRLCCLSSRSDDQQAKTVAGHEVGGDEGPVGGDLGLRLGRRGEGEADDEREQRRDGERPHGADETAPRAGQARKTARRAAADAV